MFLLKCAHEFSWILEGLYDSQLTQKNMEATPFCPLVDLFLRGVAKLKDLQDEVSYVLVIHLEASIISVVGSCIVSHTINPILPSLEAIFKNAMND